MIDSCDQKRFDEAAECLFELLEEEKLLGVPLLVRLLLNSIHALASCIV